MIDLENIAKSVQRNCHISDAKYAGYYSLCVFLLKMREYYRWEQRIPLSHSLTKSDVGDWLSQRESEWQDYENQDLEFLQINNESFDPFNTPKINQTINPAGYVYSGGYGIFKKPHFFLAELQDQQTVDGHDIFISDREIARDMVAPPAMIVGNQIFIRKESLRRFIWEKIEEWRWKSDNNTPMARALAYYHKSDMEKVLTDMCNNECHSAVLHEIGEAKATVLLGTEWKQILNELPHSGLELKLRAIKDHIADSISTLPGLLENENIPALHFYFANFTGMRKEIFPEAIDAYNEWINTRNLTVIEKLSQIGKAKWLDIATRVKQTYVKEKTVDVKNLELLLAN
jgi:hypothetical protein